MHFPDLRADPGYAIDLLPESGVPRPPLLVFSSLRWNFDYQRPQQLLTRLARHYRVVYVEEPVATHAEPFLATSSPAPGVELVIPHTGVDAPGFHDDQLPVLQALLADFVRERGFAEPFVWLCTPMALPLVADLEPRAVLYDCMDDLAGRPGAPRQWQQRESALMKLADIVVAAGPALYQAHRARHANVHCIPNAVDAEHFAPAALAGSTIESISARSLHAAIPAPRLGWFGAIDHRVDLELVDAVARLRPDWHLVMAGPLDGVDAAALPRRPNIHWLGPQTHAILPHLQAHWDACILPLKVDAAAHGATPRQALEYLAGQKSVVATPVHDVVALYGHIVRLAADAPAFVEACRAALTERGPLRRQRRIDALIAVHSCTWERAAERVHKLLTEYAHDAGEAAPVFAPALAAAAMRGRDRRYALG
jgi:glycosyltransferase involved in cell wall biosynthesis